MVTRARVGVFKPNPRYANVVTVPEPPPVPSSIRAALRHPRTVQSPLGPTRDVQLSGVNFDKSFSPVVKPATIRTVLTLSASYNWPVHQLDVSNAFLRGELKETVCCQQPTGFIDSEHPDHVCLLDKSLYGLRQAPRSWYQRFAAHLRSLGFITTGSDTSLFVLRRGND
jgi:hypothetical protein